MLTLVRAANESPPTPAIDRAEILAMAAGGSPTWGTGARGGDPTGRPTPIRCLAWNFLPVGFSAKDWRATHALNPFIEVGPV